MAVFKISIQEPKAYLQLISGITRLSKKESEILGEIVSFMQEKNLKFLDDDVKAHVLKVANYNHVQCYYNLIAKFKKKKLLLYSRKRIELKPILFPGTTLEITLTEPESILKEYETA